MLIRSWCISYHLSINVMLAFANGAIYGTNDRVIEEFLMYLWHKTCLWLRKSPIFILFLVRLKSDLYLKLKVWFSCQCTLLHAEVLAFLLQNSPQEKQASLSNGWNSLVLIFSSHIGGYKLIFCVIICSFLILYEDRM